MDVTDGILLLIAVLMAIGISIFIWHARRRTAETETMRAALYAIASQHHYFQTHEPIPITLDPSVNKAITRFARTAVDMQGMIELAARWIVLQMPPDALEDMGVPEEWPQQEAERS